MNKDLLRPFADNEPLVTEVRKLLIKQFHIDNLKPDIEVSKLGQMVLARLEAMRGINEAFKEIAQCKTHPVSSETANPAR